MSNLIRNYKNTSLYLKCSLVFFLAAAASCNKPAGSITVIYKNHLATGIKIPEGLITDASQLRATRSVKVVLADSKTRQGIFGDFTVADGEVVFTPLVPLTSGLVYHILQDGKLIGSVTVPVDTGDAPPQVMAVYPQVDTVPENLLKVYLKFSKPMRTGEALSFVCLLDKKKDTMRNVFLNLQPELWDTTATVLTLWLDPGRIKRGLVLNKALGNPLKKAETYQLVISPKWKDSHGLPLAKSYTKHFVVAARDEQIPDINTWQINAPKAGTLSPLAINTHEALDHFLLQESVSVYDGKGQLVKGSIEVTGNDKIWKFTPGQPWVAGQYQLQVKATLEDLAANNLNKVFDRDITKEVRKDNAFYKRGFVVRQE